MGHYTEIHCKLKLKKDTPKEVIDALIRGLITGEHPETEIVHPFFKTGRWSSLLQGSMEQNNFGNWILKIDSEFKNYDRELEKFCDWIAPYIQTRKKILCLGWWNYESNCEKRFNLYYCNGKIELWTHSKKEALKHEPQL